GDRRGHAVRGGAPRGGRAVVPRREPRRDPALGPAHTATGARGLMDIVTLGLVIGMANALLAVGLVLIYMATRVINLAHGELGAFAVAVMLALTRSAHLNYWLALAASLASTALL